MPHTSPLRASRGWVLLSALAGGVFAALLWASSGEVVAGIVVATATVLVLLPAQLQAAARLSWRLREFAEQVPGEPTATETFLGDQALHWPELGLTVRGGTHRFRVTGLVAETDDRRWSLQLGRPREGARRVLEAIDREPTFEGLGDRLPSLYPRLSGMKVGAIATLLVLVGIALLGPILAAGRYPLRWLAVGPLAGILVGWVRWSTIAGVRRALADLIDGLSAGGVRVETVDRLGGLVRLRFVAKTAAGPALVRCVAVPRGHLVVSLDGRARRGRFDEATSVGRTLAAWLTDRTTPPGTVAFEEPEPEDLTAAQRILFATLAAVFALLGSIMVGIAALGAGDSDAWVLAGGLLSMLACVGLLVTALRGRVPAV